MSNFRKIAEISIILGCSKKLQALKDDHAFSLLHPDFSQILVLHLIWFTGKFGRNWRSNF